jgi:hypothetical protein
MEQPKKEVPIWYLDADRKVMSDDVTKYLLWSKMTNDDAVTLPAPSSQAFIALHSNMEVERIQLKSYSKKMVEDKMVRTAQLLHLETDHGRVSCFKQIGTYWKNCEGRVPAAAKVWEIMYGTTDREGVGWEKIIADAYMAAFQVTYAIKEIPEVQSADDCSQKKGYVERFVRKALNDLIKQTNERTKTTHGRKVTVTRKATNGEITQESRFCKREKGKFDPTKHIRDSEGHLLSKEVILAEMTDAVSIRIVVLLMLLSLLLLSN